MKHLLILAALASLPGADAPPAAVVPAVRAEVQPEIARHLAGPEGEALAELARGNRTPALFKLPCRVKAITDPWGGLADLERHGLGVAAAARGGLPRLGTLLDRLGATAGLPAGVEVAVPRGRLDTLDDHAAYIEAVLDRARELRDAAVAPLSADERRSLFARPAELVNHFSPQLPFDADTRPTLEKDREFCTLLHDRCDWAKLAGAAKVLAQLADPDYLARLKAALEAARPIAEAVPGVTGDLLFKKATRHGLILFGGRGDNTYHLTTPVACLVDLGGNDTYRGALAASFDADHPNGVLIDFAGNDTYECDPLGLATGRLGVGLLLDLAGNDTYKLAPGSGGVGLGGIGILCDAVGDDTYTGSRFTQGAGLAGVGLLLDLAGNDRHTSFGYALGFGGPGGVGALVDVAGNDSYQCGRHYPSGYNESDAPTAKPGDANFQYDCFGMGMGMGRRVFSGKPEEQAFSLAGGVGMLIDVAGDDRYDSSNFSQGCGYFFGVGLKLDLAGDDIHAAARYGHAAAAHFGLGLFIDYAGRDTYTSSGPTYNCGCAWDRSVCLFVDAGAGDDTYDLSRSSGLGMADIGSWAVFADLGGKDRYGVGVGLGRASQKAIAVFFDRAGEDDYRGAAGAGAKPANGKTESGTPGGLFIDR
jgi:hypothetical protein